MMNLKTILVYGGNYCKSYCCRRLLACQTLSGAIGGFCLAFIGPARHGCMRYR